MTEKKANMFLCDWGFPKRYIFLKKEDLTGVSDSAFNILDKYVENFEKSKNIKYLIENELPLPKQRGLYLCSKLHSTGKSSLSVYIVRELLKKDKIVGRCTFYEDIDFHTEIRKTFGSKLNDYSEIMERVQEDDILVLDDFNKKRISDYVLETTSGLINKRYNSVKPIIFTSNYRPEDLDIVKEGEKGEALMNRIMEMVDVIVL